MKTKQLVQTLVAAWYGGFQSSQEYPDGYTVTLQDGEHIHKLTGEALHNSHGSMFTFEIFIKGDYNAIKQCLNAMPDDPNHHRKTDKWASLFDDYDGYEIEAKEEHFPPYEDAMQIRVTIIYNAYN